MDQANYNLLGVGVYSVAEAARLTSISSQRIRRWLSGYRYKAGDEERERPPIWRAQLPALDHQVALGFKDLIEVRFVNAFIEHGVSLHTIRLAAIKASDLVADSHPFTTKAFKTDGRSIFAEIQRQTGERELLDLAKSQYAFRQVISPSLYAGLDFSEAGEATRWWPLGKKRLIVLDPQRAFGQPIVDSEGVPTAILARAFHVEKSFQKVASWYAVDVKSVRAAVEFEKKLAA